LDGTNDQSAGRAIHEAFDDLRDRVRTMALVHENLYQSETLANINFAEYASALTASLARSHGRGNSDIRLTLDVEPVTLSIESAVPCGLILNELVTNAYKHAFRDRTSGEIVVSLRADSTGRVCLGVRDNGVGLLAGVDWRQGPSLGLRLVQMLARQVGGIAECRRSAGGGTEFVVEFPGKGKEG
jgi:two-component sensor histidine kinase